MAIKIVMLHTAIQDFNIGHIPLDRSRKTAVLIRQSRKKADKDHYESRLLQENLVFIAMQIRGETDTTYILVYDEGAGISGTKGYDERPKLSQLYLDIENGIVGSLIVARPDRLFRDKHFLNVGMFTELAERRKLILIVPGRRFYDFTKYEDLKAFQKDMQDAYNYVATQVRYMNDAREQKVMRGMYGGSSLPAPYAIDKTSWKEEQIPIIYQPWLEPALDLFKRFKSYDFSIAHICRYIESLPYLFPLPSPEDIQRYMFRTRMRLQEGGYTFNQISSVIYYLSNLTLGGYAKIGKDAEGNTLLLPDAFEAAIPFDLLDPSYAAITGFHIDGTPYAGIKNKRRYMRRNPDGPTAILHGLLTSDQGHVSAMPVPIAEGVRYEYRCYKGLSDENHPLKVKTGLLETKQWWALNSPSLDRIVFQRLCDLAEHDRDLAERVKEVFESMKGQAMDESMLLGNQIKQTEARIKRLDFLLKTPSIPLDETTAVKYALELAELNQKLPRLIKKQQAQPTYDPGETIANFYHILAHLQTEFPKQNSDVQKLIMSRLINQVTVNNISPHLFRLYIVWQEGVATRPDAALLWRGIAVKDLEEWSEEEKQLVRTLYPRHSQLDILRALPRRSFMMIRQHARELQVAREIRVPRRTKVNPYPETVSYADLEAAMQYGESEEDKAYMGEIVKTLIANTSKGEITAYWPLPVDVVGLSDIINNRESRPRQGQRSPPKRQR